MNKTNEEKTPRQIMGGKLKELREAAGVSQSQVAAAFNWKRWSFISDWEHGNRKVPLRCIQKLAKLYKVPTLTIREILAREQIESTKVKFGVGQKKRRTA